MEEQILDILKQDNRAFTVYELNDALGLKTFDELKELLKSLNRLEDSLKIYPTKKDSYLLFNNSHLKLGTLLANKKGFGFVDIEGNEDVFIAPTNMNKAIHGDKVVVEITSKKGMDLEGRIVRIVNREIKEMVGEYYVKDGKGYIDLDDEKVKLDIEIDKDRSMSAMPGHKVLVKVLGKLKDNHYKTLTMEEFKRWMYHEIELPEKSVLITIDDGALGTGKHNGNKLIPILEEDRMHAALFLITGWWDIENYRSNYLEIESHTFDMHTYGDCGRGQLICESKENVIHDLKKSIDVTKSTNAFNNCFNF